MVPPSPSSRARRATASPASPGPPAGAGLSRRVDPQMTGARSRRRCRPALIGYNISTCGLRTARFLWEGDRCVTLLPEPGPGPNLHRGDRAGPGGAHPADRRRPRRRLAAVARPAARRRLARDGHPRQVPRRRPEGPLARRRSAPATPARPSPAAGSTSPTASSPRGPATRATPSPRNQRRPGSERVLCLDEADRQGALEARVRLHLRDQLPRRPARHAGRRRRQGLHARRDGRPVLPRRRQRARSSGRRTS